MLVVRRQRDGKMTAEIAILNRTGVALAADSAATLMGGRSAKANNNADKLFHLCDGQPVGLLIFGSAEFMGVPLEPLVKEFRGCRLAVRRERLINYADAFFEFLEKIIPVSEYSKSTHIRGLIESLIKPLIRRAINKLFADDTVRKSGTFQSAFASFLLEGIKKETIDVSEKEDCAIMGDMTVEFFADSYKADAEIVIREQLKNTPFQMKDDVIEGLRVALLELLTTFIRALRTIGSAPSYDALKG